MQDLDSKSLLDHRRNMRIAFIGLAVFFALSIGIQFFINPVMSTILYIMDIVGVIVTAAFLITSFVLSRRGKPTQAILLIITTLLILMVAQAFVIKGVALLIGAAGLAAITGITVFTLHPIWFGRISAISIGSVIALLIIDQYTTGPITIESSTTLWVLSALFGTIYVWIIASKYNTYNLQIKFIIGLVGMAVIPLIIIGSISYLKTRQILQSQTQANLRETAFRNSALLSGFVQDQITIMRSEARLTDVILVLETPRYEFAGSPQEKESLENINTMARRDTIYIYSYTLVDKDGIVVLDTDSKNIGKNISRTAYFKQSIENISPYVSSTLIDPETSQPTLFFSVPVISNNGQNIGILLVKYNATIIQSLLKSAEESRSIISGYTFVLDGTTFVDLAHTQHVEVINKTYKKLSEIELLDLQHKGVLKSGSLSDVVFSQPDIVTALDNMDVLNEFTIPAWESNGGLTEMAAVRVPGTPWILVSAQPLSTLDDLVRSQTSFTVISISIVIFFASVIAYFLSSLFTNPILNITHSAENILQGDFSGKARVETHDEIGVLARTFNAMSTQIQELIGGLEERVAQRTADSEVATKQNQKRAGELQTIAEIARIISTEHDLEKLLTLICIIVSERFNYYHVGIFLLDESRKFAVLRAANSDGGQIMLKRNHKLEVGQVGIVGNVTSTGNPRIAVDTGVDAIYFNNPDLPNTRSEMSLPLIVRGTIMGALDVQSVTPDAFTQEDISILSLLVDQVAVAIENTRLLDETQKALTESQSVYRDYVTNAWQKKTIGGVTGYHLSSTGGRIINSDSPSDNKNGDESHASISIPIRVREQVIGALNIRSINGQKKLTTDEINVIEAITERLGLALDNARLFEETTTRASRERAVADITTKIRSTNDPQEMIRTALDELQQILGARDIEVVSGRAQQKSDT